MTRRVALVTGASGFIGRHALAPLSAAGFTVHSAGRRPVAGVEHHALDLFDRAALRVLLTEIRPTHLLHCAWDVTHGVFWRSPANLDWSAASLLLAREALDAGVERLVGVGTCAEYDWSDGGSAPRREGDPLSPDTLYGSAKAATSALLQAACRSAGAGFAWGRLFHLFGPDEPAARLLPSIVEALRAGRPALCRNGQLVRDLLPAEAAGAALAALLASGVEGAVNVASGRGLTLGAAAEAAAGILGRPDLLTVARQPAPGQPGAMVADVSRLTREVGFAPPEPLSALAAFLRPA